MIIKYIINQKVSHPNDFQLHEHNFIYAEYLG